MLARELTKLHEEVWRGTLAEAAHLSPTARLAANTSWSSMAGRRRGRDGWRHCRRIGCSVPLVIKEGSGRGGCAKTRVPKNRVYVLASSNPFKPAATAPTDDSEPPIGRRCPRLRHLL